MGTKEVKDTSFSLWNWEFWKGQLIYRTTTRKTTWKFRLLVVALLLILPAATYQWWVPALGWSLVSDSGIEKPDLILIDNLDTNYLLFEKAGDMKRRGLNVSVLVPVSASGKDPERPGLVARRIVEVMIEVAHLDGVELLPIQETEPITLNVARQVSEHLKGSNVGTVLILTSGFKTKRIHLIFSRILGEQGIDTYCLPVWGTHKPETWASTWHGIQEVFLQHAKLAYYRLWVL